VPQAKRRPKAIVGSSRLPKFENDRSIGTKQKKMVATDAGITPHARRPKP